MTKYEILLIAPRNPIGEGSSLPPLGLATIAGHIRDDYNIEIIDESIDNPDYNSLNPDIVGISANTINVGRAYQISNEFRRRNTPVILGGIHPTAMPDEATKFADSVIIGEGEVAITDALRDFEKGDLQRTYNSGFINLDDSNIPRRDLFTGDYPMQSIQTSKGCPFNCNFCSVKRVNGREYRKKALENVAEDLDSISSKYVFLVDDNFLGYGRKDESRAKGLMGVLKDSKKYWVGQTSLNIVDNLELLKLAGESNALMFYIGFESISEDFLKYAGKKVNLKKSVKSYGEVIKIIHDNGIAVMGSFMYGTDFDTRDSLFELRDTIHEIGVDVAIVKPLTPLPGSELYDEFIENGRLFRNDFWLEDPYPIFTIKPENLSMEDMKDFGRIFIEETKPSLRNFLRTLWNTRNTRSSIASHILNRGNYKKLNALLIV